MAEDPEIPVTHIVSNNESGSEQSVSSENLSRIVDFQANNLDRRSPSNPALIFPTEITSCHDLDDPCYRPRGGVGSEHNPQASSDSDDSTTSHHGQQHPQHQPNAQQQASHVHQTQGQQTSMHGYGLPKVQVSGPPNTPESSYSNG